MNATPLPVLARLRAVDPIDTVAPGPLGPTLVHPSLPGKIGERFAAALRKLRRSFVGMTPLPEDRQAIRGVGVAPARHVGARTITSSLGSRRPEVVRAPDSRSGTAEVTRTASVIGRHVLLVEPAEMVRLLAYRLMEDAGMRVDAFARVDKARASLRTGSPDVVVIGLPVDDQSSSGFLDEARAAQPRLRVIQLVDDDDAFSFSVPDSNRPAQIGRQGLEHTLVSAVAEELDAAWAD